MIISISGKIGSGKDTVADIIQSIDISRTWEVKKWAGKLKQVATLLTGIPMEKWEDQEFKKIGVSYNFGQFAAGAERAVDTAGTTSKVELTRNTFGLTFAANDNLSFGISYGETE